jgi:cell division protein FtsQ
MRRIIDKLRFAAERSRRRHRLPKWARQSLLGLSVVAIIAGYLITVAQISRNGWLDDQFAIAQSWLSQRLASAGFGVKSIVAFGASQTEAQSLRAAIAVAPRTPILDLNLSEIRQKVEALPWVRVASVERSLPDRLIVRIVERRPVALLQQNGVLSLIDDTGATIRDTALLPFTGLPTITGTGAAKAAPTLLKLLQEAPTLASRVTAATRFGDRRWDVRVDDRVWIRLPELAPADAWRQFARLEADTSVLNRAALSVDIRDPRQWAFELPQGMRLRSAIENNGS